MTLTLTIHTIPYPLHLLQATVFTPEYPEGRQMVLIANDITVQAGSFGTREDTVFRYVVTLSHPVVYVCVEGSVMCA